MILKSCNTNKKQEQNLNALLLSNVKNKASCVSFSTDEKNTPIISWCETDTATKNKYFFLAFFNNDDKHFSKPVPVPIQQNAGIHEEGMPKIAVKGDGTIVAVYETSAPTKENEWAGYIRYIQSFDKGKTWAKPLYLDSDTAAGKEHSFASITHLSDGEIGACWLNKSFNYKKQGRPVIFAKSNDDKGFQKEILIDSIACECCRTAISSDDRGGVSIMFRNILHDSVRDISVSTSNDNGKTFTPAISFSNDDWVMNGCPHNGPAVARTEKNIYAVWFTGGNQRGVYYAELDNDGKTILKKHISAEGRFIQLCLLPDEKKILAYNENIRKGDSVYSTIVLDKIDGNKIFTEDITPQNSHANYSVVQSINNSNIIAAWEENDRIYYRTVDVKSIVKPAQQLIKQTVLAKPDFSKLKFALAKDPSCGMPLTAGIGDTAHYKRKLYGFYSTECKNEFLKNPSAYIATK